MSDTGSSGAALSSPSDDRTLAFVGYALMFVAPFVFGLTALIGVVIAYVRRPDAPPVERSHYRYQVRTFWIGFILSMIAAVGLVVSVGFLFADVIRYLFANMPSDAWDAVSQEMEMSFPVVTFVGLIVSGCAWVAAAFWMVLTSVVGAVRLSGSHPMGRTDR